MRRTRSVWDHPTAIVGVLMIGTMCSGKVAAQQTRITVDDIAVMEGMNIRVHLTSSSAVPAGFALVLRTADITTAGAADYTLPAAPVMFVGKPGEEVNVLIPTVDDAVSEYQEAFTLFLTSTNPDVDVSDQATVTITDNEPATLHISNARAVEGADLVFKITLDKPVPGGFDVLVSPAPITGIINGTLSGLEKLLTFVFPNGLDDPRDFKAEPVLLHFQGDANEEQEVHIETFVDFTAQEPLENVNIGLGMVGAGAPVNVAATGVGTIVDPGTRKHCPPESFLKKNPSHELMFFGDGALLSTYKEDAKLAANTGVGIRWVEHFPDNAQQRFGPWYKVELEGQVNIASTADSLIAEQDTLYNSVANTSAFGNSILVPKISGQSADVRLTLYNKQTWGGLISGLSFRYAGANNYWSRQDPIADSMGVVIGSKPVVGQVNAHMLRASLFHDFVNYEERKDFSVMLRAGFVYHWIRGDLGAEGAEKERERFLGSTQRGHRGWEIGLSFRLKNLEADVSYSNLYNAKGYAAVEGLDGGRLVTTIRFVGGFKAELK